MSDVTFDDSAPPATEAQLQTVEKALGHPMPATYRVFLQMHNGAKVDPANFRMPDGEYLSLDKFLGTGQESDTGTIEYALKTFADRYPKEYTPIARAAGGSLLLMDAQGKLFFWDIEEEEPELSTNNIHPAADSLEQLLATLED